MTGRRTLATLTGAMALVAPASAHAFDATIAGIEVTQAVQTPANAISLIADRSTVVRVTVAVADNGGQELAGVSGRLHVLQGDKTLTPPEGIAPDNAQFVAKLQPQRPSEADTLNFRLPAPTGLEQGTATFRVQLLPPAGDSNPANDARSVGPLGVVEAPDLRVYYLKVDYRPSGLGLPSDALIGRGAGDAFLAGILPVNDADPNLYQQLPGNDEVFEGGANGGSRMSPCCQTNPALDDPDIADLVDAVQARRDLIVDDGVSGTDRVAVIGWVAGNPCDCNGSSIIGGRVAFSNTQLTRGQRTFAHELGHAVGTLHDTRALDQVGFDAVGRLAATWPGTPPFTAGNGVGGRVKPTTLNNFMVPAKLTNDAWIDTSAYRGLIQQLIINPRQRRVNALVRQTIINGTIRREISRTPGTSPVTLRYAYTYPWRVAAIRPTAGAVGQLLSLSLKTFRGQTLSRQVRANALNTDSERDTVQLFRLPITLPSAGIKTLEIRRPGSSSVLFKRTFSKASPRVKVLSPAAGATLRGRTVMRWRATDADTKSSSLRFQVAFSHDGGRNFFPVDVDIKGASVAFDARRLRPSSGRGLLRVFVSDGLNSSYADVRGLSVPKG